MRSYFLLIGLTFHADPWNEIIEHQQAILSVDSIIVGIEEPDIFFLKDENVNKEGYVVNKNE